MDTRLVDALVDEVAADLGPDRADGVELTGDPDPAVLSSPLSVIEVATATVSSCLLAAADLAAARGIRRPVPGLDTGHVSAAVLSEAWLRDANGRGLAGFAPLSRLWPTSDGWVRTHGNYPWHRAALLAAFGVEAGADDETARRQLAAAMAGRPGLDIEQLVTDGGGLAVAARTHDAWGAHPAGRALAGTPLIEVEATGGPAPALTGPPVSGGLPAAGVRVLDLTRVIAGPVGTRMLAALGADVLRVDPPGCPELPLHAVDGVTGKSSTLLDAADPAGRAVLHALVEAADVLVTGYRPGSLDALDLGPAQVAADHPGTVVVTLSAWGTAGPWGGRRGFDSLVQVASGIAEVCARGGDVPGALPCQLLDHGTGYLVAAAALAGLAHRARTGEAVHARLSLARTADWLLDQGVDPDAPSPDPGQAEEEAERHRVAVGDGWTAIAPPGDLDGQPLQWPDLPPRYGRSLPRFRPH